MIPFNGEHLYAAALQEYEVLPSYGWNQEGSVWRSL
ncbi:hypothetical protein [uncultured Bifidobacterium sp.]